MYKFEHYRQLGLADFNQPLGFKMNPENRWVKKAATIPWDAIEEKYAKLFPSKTGMPVKPLRMALGMERENIGSSKSADNSPLSSVATDSCVSWRICKIGTINEPVGIMAHWDNYNYSSLHIHH